MVSSRAAEIDFPELEPLIEPSIELVEVARQTMARLPARRIDRGDLDRRQPQQPVDGLHPLDEPFSLSLGQRLEHFASEIVASAIELGHFLSTPRCQRRPPNPPVLL